MPRYRIPIVEHSWGVVVVEADTLEDAKGMVDEGFDGSEEYYYHNIETEYELEGVEVDE